MYILIVLGWVGGYTVGISVATTQEFSSEQNCELARLALAKSYREWGGGDKLKTLCVPK